MGDIIQRGTRLRYLPALITLIKLLFCLLFWLLGAPCVMVLIWCLSITACKADALCLNNTSNYQSHWCHSIVYCQLLFLPVGNSCSLFLAPVSIFPPLIFPFWSRSPEAFLSLTFPRLFFIAAPLPLPSVSHSFIFLWLSIPTVNNILHLNTNKAICMTTNQ